MKDVDLDRILRLERGELSGPDADTGDWPVWIGALRQAAGTSLPLPEEGESAPDPMDVAALAEGALSSEEAREVRLQLARCPDGYEQLAAAMAESSRQIEPPAALPAEPTGSSPPATSPARPRWLRAAAWGAALAAAILVAQLIRHSATDGAPDVSALALRQPMAVPTLRAAGMEGGLAAYRAADYARAAAELAEIVAERPKDGPAWLYLGSARLLLGDDAQAVQALGQARATCEGSFAIEATWQLAQAHLAVGDDAGARGLLLELEGTRRAQPARDLLRALDRVLDRARSR